MYRPRHFDETDLPTLHRFMRESSFATLVTSTEAGLLASHVPFVLAEGGPDGLGMLRAHLARANDHWRSLEGAESLVIFSGVHGYISPSWYAESPSVPTWDYIAVHAYGPAALVTGESEVLAMLHELVDQYESGRPQPWRSEELPADYLSRMAKGVVAFELSISRLEGKAKLGQNRPAEQSGVAVALEREGQVLLASEIRRANAIEGGNPSS